MMGSGRVPDPLIHIPALLIRDYTARKTNISKMAAELEVERYAVAKALRVAGVPRQPGPIPKYTAEERLQIANARNRSNRQKKIDAGMCGVCGKQKPAEGRK